MKALVLAAGKSERLRPLTDRIPKPMLVVAGRPVLEHNVRLLLRHGVTELIINLHHEPDVIRSYFSDGAAFGTRIAYSWEPDLLGTAGAVKRLQQEFTETFLVVYGDNLTNCNLGELIAFHKSHGGCATIALFPREDVLASGIVGIDPAGRVLQFLEKPSPDRVFSHWVNAGVLVLEPSVLAHIPDGVSDFGRDVLPGLVACGMPVFGYTMTEQLWWIDTPEDYQRTVAMAESGQMQLA